MKEGKGVNYQRRRNGKFLEELKVLLWSWSRRGEEFGS